MLRKRSIAATVPVVAVVALLFLSSGCSRVSARPEELTLGIPASDNAALVYIADERGYFRDENLKVAIRDYQAGGLAVGDVENGKIDVAAASEFVFAGLVLAGRDLKTIGTIGAANNCAIVARKDLGITRPEDLAGRKVGVLHGSAMEFFLGTFLAFHDMPPSTVETVNVQPADLASALSKGAVDAVVGFGPYPYKVEAAIGDRAVVWPIQGEQDYYLLLICKAGLTEGRPDAVKRLLSALVKAEEFTRAHPAEARKIMQKRLGLSEDEAYALWLQNRYDVRLPQNLLLLMEDETKWLEHRWRQKRDVPDYRVHVYQRALKSVKPEAAGIVE